MKTKKLEQLTFIRFVAAILVVIWHFGRDVFPFNTYAVDFFNKGDLGVSFFFFLSGFVMILAYGHKKQIDFYEYLKKRIARIYPVFVLAAMLVLFNKLISNSDYLNFKGLALHLSMLQAWIPDYQLTYNIAAWTLSVEFLFYLLFPIIYNRFYSNSAISKRVVFGIVFIWILTQLIDYISTPSLFFTYENQLKIYYEYLRLHPLMHLNQFLIGNLAGIFFIRNNQQKNYDFLIIVNLILIFIMLNYFFYLNLFHGLALVLFAPFIFLISSNNGKITEVLKTKPLIFLGEISYGIYILQFPIFYLLEKFYRKLNFNNFTLRFYVSILILIIISGISYVFFEKPMRKMILNFKLKKKVKGSK